MATRVEDQGEKNEGLSWGKSAKVPSVQELIRKDPKIVPERYIREINEISEETKLFLASSQIPTIDFLALINGNEDEKRKLDLACKEWGFFQIVNHGVPEDVVKNMKASVAAFFELPLEEKMKYAMAADDVQGYGQTFVVSEQQKLEWCDMMFLIAHPSSHKNMKYWPLAIPGFKDAVEQYSLAICHVTEEMLGSLSLLLGLEKDTLEQMHEEMRLGLRMNYYPPCAKPDLVLGIGPHSDAGSITVLLQDDEIIGLQIRYKDQWLPVTPIPNAFVVNVGDALEGWSNGLYKSIEHRAVTNSTVGRMSIAAFGTPANEANMGPVSTMVEGRPRMYKNIKFVDYLHHYFDRKLDGKSNTDFLKLVTEDH